jgi:TatD DNase family protein
MTSLVDSHSHLDGDAFDADREEVIVRARAAGVEWLVAIGSGNGPPDLRAGIRLAETHTSTVATIGVHPHDASKATAETYPELIELTTHEKVVAVGEIGLDYHYDLSPREVQREVFVRQLEIAREARLPVVIHTREAWEDTIDLLRGHWDTSIGGIFHCFSHGLREAEQAVQLGFYVSFSGIVTFPTATGVHDAARLVPTDRILVETDCPYLAPVPHRGKRNEPSYLVHTAQRLAELRGVSLELLARQTTANWKRLCLRRSGVDG